MVWVISMIYANLSFHVYILMYCLRFTSFWNLCFLICSYNFDQLASACHVLFPSCGAQNEILWAQTFWAESCNWIWDFKWDLNWTFKFEPGFQFCWLLSSMFIMVLFFSRVHLIIVDSEHLYDIPFQMTKLAIIPCTVLLETIFLGKRFRFHLASYEYYDFFNVRVLIYTWNDNYVTVTFCFFSSHLLYLSLSHLLIVLTWSMIVTDCYAHFSVWA